MTKWCPNGMLGRPGGSLRDTPSRRNTVKFVSLRATSTSVLYHISNLLISWQNPSLNLNLKPLATHLIRKTRVTAVLGPLTMTRSFWTFYENRRLLEISLRVDGSPRYGLLWPKHSKTMVNRVEVRRQQRSARIISPMYASCTFLEMACTSAHLMYS